MCRAYMRIAMQASDQSLQVHSCWPLACVFLLWYLPQACHAPAQLVLRIQQAAALGSQTVSMMAAAAQPH